VWQWWNHARAQIGAGRQPLRINLDETAICLYQGDVKGTVFACKRRQRDEAVQRVGRGKRRCYMTHVGVICDRPDLQPLMPQFIIGNERIFLARSIAALRAACPGNIILVRQKSAWNNDVLCATVVRRLAAVLAPHTATVQPILFLDAVRLHTTPRVLRACATAGIWPIVVPALMTWLLQPLDTDAFLPFKQRLRELYQSARARSADGDVGVDVLLQCLYNAIRAVLQVRRWATAFEKAGLGYRQLGVAPHVLRHLQLQSPPAVPSTRPTDEQLRACFPRRTEIHSRAVVLWRAVDGSPAAGAHGVGSAGSSGVLAVAERPRTRGDHARAARAIGPARAAAAAPAIAAASTSPLVAALARGRPLLVPRGRPLFLRGRGRGAGR
jgi:hypothetical protein